MNTLHASKAALAAILISSAGANAGTDSLKLARSYELTSTSAEYSSLLNESALSDIKTTIQIQARYQYNKRDDAVLGDNDTTMGFSMRRVKVGIEGKITDNISGKVKFAFSRSSGAAALEDAYGKWKINDDLTLKFGQFKQGLLREENISSSKQLASDRSAVNETFNQDFSQGIEAHFGGDSWRGLVGFTDGFGTDNTAFNSAAEADYALNARVEFLFGDASWSQFKQFTSFRGATQGSMLGLGIAYQSMGNTNPTPTETEMTTGTIDYSFLGDGWNFYLAGVWQNSDPAAGVSTDDYGIIAQGGMFVTDQDELFARWDVVMADESNAPADNDFNSLTFGWNHYIIPESHAAKFTLDINYYLDATSDNAIVSTSASGGVNLQASTEDGQIGITAQMQILF